MKNIELNKYQFNLKRFTWYFPWQWYSWKPSIMKSCDEWHNKSIVITIPLLGGFCWFISWNKRAGEEHIWGLIRGEILGYDDVNCVICQELKEIFES
jgi:hypothetical protein